MTNRVRIRSVHILKAKIEINKNNYFAGTQGLTVERVNDQAIMTD